MIEIVPFKAEHVMAMEPIFEQGKYKAWMTPAAARTLEGPFARTAMLDGEPLACAGLVNKWVDSWLVWAYLSKDSGRHMLALTRAITRAFPDLPRGRIEATTPIHYAAGRRWLEMLGFHCETPNGMAHYTPDGSTFMQYARVS